ncbi:MAG: GFA family protein [Desulfobacterales bacterium]
MMKTLINEIIKLVYSSLFVSLVLLVLSGYTSKTDITRDISVNEKNDVTEFTSTIDTVIITLKASCRCGNLTVSYEGPVPQRRTLCHCNSCQLRTGSAFSIQARLPRDKSIIEGKSSEWIYPNDPGKELSYRSCDSGGATFHFCPTCGTTVYWDIASDPEIIGVALGTITDSSFPAPVISAFEAYGYPWAMAPEDLEIIRLEYDELEEKLKELNNKN